MKSIYEDLGGIITMPEFKKRKLYMHKMSMNEILLPSEFKDYEETIYNILTKVKDKNNVCYVTIDEKLVNNDTHRRAGAHVDFNWFESLNRYNGETGHKRNAVMGGWDNGGGGHNGSGNNGGHGSGNNPNGNHGGSPPATHCNLAEFNKNGGMLLVSNYPACKVWKGEFEGEIGEGGCCKGIEINALKSEIIPAGNVFYINALGIHESLKIERPIERSLVRINFHPEYIFKKN